MVQISFRSFSTAVAILCAAPAMSGQLFEDRVRCPIGGKRVLVVSTTSCSTGPRVTMSLRRPSSCDFITRLPVCEKQDFPVYREFTADEKRLLRQIVLEEWYQAARSKSRYLRAYLVEKQLKNMSEEDVFWLLQAGHFYDPENTFGNEEYYSAFREAANSYLPLAKDEDKKLVLLMAAYAQIHLGSPQKAKTMVKAASQIQTPTIPFFDQYLKAVIACITIPRADECGPDYEIEIQR